ncbi:hypothetical protein QAD02_002850 [Eretmocerus hayati]|uniref:Uncharacterized protein n=1 Tax=Eretmocerus hayati TaxID=131215 RepID=A0ACC2NLT9_9HYME|nr:hypothetical protein QAD02_002850 [Eretmocerus hayati]
MFNRTQERIVINSIVDHTEVGLGHQTNLGPNGKITYRALWDRLLCAVNRAGPPLMTNDQLMKAWTSMRLEAKDKMATFKKQKAKTGNTAMTAILTEKDQEICKLFNNFALDTFINEIFGFGLESQLLCVDKDTERLKQSEKALITEFMEKNPEYLDGLLIYVGTEEQKAHWEAFITRSKDKRLTTKTGEKLLNCWIDAIGRLRNEVRTQGDDKLSKLKKRIYILLQEHDKKEALAECSKKKFSQCDSAKNLIDDYKASPISKKQDSKPSTSFYMDEDTRSRKRQNSDDSAFDLIDTDCYISSGKKPHTKPSHLNPEPDRSSESRSKPIDTLYTIEELEEKIDNNTLDLAQNDLCELPDVVMMLQFTHIRLEKNFLTALPNGLTTLIGITRIEVQENFLEELPHDIGSLVELKHLNVASNKLMTLPVSMGELKKLKYLNVRGNPLQEQLIEIAGPSQNSDDCKRCAEAIVGHFAALKIQKDMRKSSTLRDGQLPYHDDSYIVSMGDKSVQVLENAVTGIDKLANIGTNMSDRQDEMLNVLKDLLNETKEIRSYQKKHEHCCTKQDTALEEKENETFAVTLDNGVEITQEDEEIH